MRIAAVIVVAADFESGFEIVAVDFELVELSFELRHGVFQLGSF